MILSRVVEVMVVLSPTVQRQCTLQNSLVTIASIILCQWRRRQYVCRLFTFRNISTESYVQTQVLESMYFIVDVCVTYERTADSLIIAEFQHRNRVLCSLRIVSPVPCRVIESTSCKPLVITTEVTESRVCGSYRLCRVIIKSCTDSTGIYEITLRPHTFCIEVHREVVIKE